MIGRRRCVLQIHVLTNADWALAAECCLQPSPACDSEVTSAQTESGLCYGGGFGKQGSFTVKRNCPSPEQFPGEPAPDSPVTASYYVPLNVVSSFFFFFNFFGEHTNEKNAHKYLTQSVL